LPNRVDKPVKFLYLSQEDCINAGATDMKGTLSSIEDSFKMHGNKDIIQPIKSVIRWGGPETEETNGRIMSMPSYIGGNKKVAGIKWIPSIPENPKKYNLPRANALIILTNVENGLPLAVMDGTIVSAMRTGAATGIAAKYLAKEHSETIGLIGAGVQSRTQLMAIKEVFKHSIKKVKVFDLNYKKSEIFAKELGEELNLTIIPAKTAEDTIRNSDIIVTATMSSSPYVKGEWLKNGAFHSEISFWDTATNELQYYDKVYVDDWEQVKKHAVGVTYRGFSENLLKESEISQLVELIVNGMNRRENDNEKILFNPVAMAIHDISEAYRIYKNALNLEIGQQLTLWNQPYWT